MLGDDYSMIVDSEHWGLAYADINKAVSYTLINPVKDNYRKPWLAKITGRCKKFGYQREFVKARFFSAVTIGGTVLQRTEFPLEKQCLYEFKFFIASMSPFEQVDDFILVLNNGLTRVKRDDVKRWLHILNPPIEEDVPF